jgi:hypothetical protein
MIRVSGRYRKAGSKAGGARSTCTSGKALAQPSEGMPCERLPEVSMPDSNGVSQLSARQLPVQLGCPLHPPPSMSPKTSASGDNAADRPKR